MCFRSSNYGSPDGLAARPAGSNTKRRGNRSSYGNNNYRTYNKKYTTNPAVFAAPGDGDYYGDGHHHSGHGSGGHPYFGHGSGGHHHDHSGFGHGGYHDGGSHGGGGDGGGYSGGDGGGGGGC